jgi:HD-GYP domain-containing protein (c-di-GMP phosphodiesterase class II)
VKRHIRLRGIDGAIEGTVWETDTQLQAGRLETLEIVLSDSSVSRRHAEIRANHHGWLLRDLKSTNGTFLNGVRLGTGEWPLRVHDVIRLGNVTLVIDELQDGKDYTGGNPEQIVVEAATRSSWEEAINGLAYNRNRSPRPGEQLLALLRAGHHLGHHESEEELLHSILNDAVSALDAQRGAIVLAEGPAGPLHLRAAATSAERPGSRGNTVGRPGFSQHLAQRSFNGGESILCHKADEDPELAMARSIAEGAMASVLCVLLRTPRKRLGVLHLDRGPMQAPFTQDDLHLADALAANVSAGIESAQLLRKERDLFFNTITILAQAVEMRDTYTGNHTQRVTRFSVLLGKELDLPEDQIYLIKIGTPLHDIGKIGIKDEILNKPGRLTPEEFKIMQSHTVKGAEILETIPDLVPVIPIVRSHHERWDGRGYPDGLAGEAIPSLARIVAVADAFDAMTSDRPYRKGMPADVAFAEVRKQAGLQFDPAYAEAFLNIRSQLVQELQTDATCNLTAVAEEAARKVS